MSEPDMGIKVVDHLGTEITVFVKPMGPGYWARVVGDETGIVGRGATMGEAVKVLLESRARWDKSR